MTIKVEGQRALVRTLPSWMSAKLNKKGTKLKLRGDRTWKGQPVINTIRVKLTDTVTGINVNQAMAAAWRFEGTKGNNRFVFGNTAGAITKRSDSIIDFGADEAKDVFVFKNSVPGKPFNHMQRFTIRNFGREDVIKLKNIGRTFRFDDLQRAGDGVYVLPGVSPASLTVFG